MSKYYQIGNTVRLISEFKDWDGSLVDPVLIKIILYDSQFRKIEENSIGAANKIEIGKYYFDYVPQITGTIFYEWYGVIDGLPSLKRGTLITRLI